jgi:hypothetical protein
MVGKYIWLAAAAGLLSIAAVLTACTPKTRQVTPVTTTPGPGGGLVVNSDSIITGKTVAIRSESTGYPWQIDVQVLTSQDVGTLPNPTKDKIGQTVSFYTDENVSAFRVGQSINAHVKYAGDVPKPGIVLYIFDIK